MKSAKKRCMFSEIIYDVNSVNDLGTKLARKIDEELPKETINKMK